MKHSLLLAIILMGSSSAFAQEAGSAFFYQSAGPVTTAGVGVMGRPPGAPVQGAPYSATMTNENIQTLEDGTHINQTSTGNVARDSEGRTRQDASLPTIGNLSAADAPHFVFIQDPVAQTAYTLNLTDKTAQKIPALPPLPMTAGTPGAMTGGKFVMQMGTTVSAGGPPPIAIGMQRALITSDQGQVKTEDLGTQTMEGVLVSGVRTTHTIPAGEIGNDRPIQITTEVWTSPDLKTIIYSKRTDPRMGEQTFRLTNVVRTEPDPSLFTVPPDFKMAEGPQDVLYRSNP